MNATLGHWLFSTLSAHQTRALLKSSGHPAIMGTFNPDAGAVPDLAINPSAFQARYALPFHDLWGSEIGEGRVPDRSELQERVRKADDPCLLTNNSAYVVTEIDVLDFRYVARSGRPDWEFIETLHIFDPQGDECQEQLQAARQQITALQTELSQKNARIAQLEAEVARLAALVPVAVPADIDQTVALLKGAGNHLDIGPGIKARFTRLGRFVDTLKARHA